MSVFDFGICNFKKLYDRYVNIDFTDFHMIEFTVDSRYIIFYDCNYYFVKVYDTKTNKFTEESDDIIPLVTLTPNLSGEYAVLRKCTYLRYKLLSYNGSVINMEISVEDETRIVSIDCTFAKKQLKYITDVFYMDKTDTFYIIFDAIHVFTYDRISGFMTYTTYTQLNYKYSMVSDGKNLYYSCMISDNIILAKLDGSKKDVICCKNVKIPHHGTASSVSMLVIVSDCVCGLKHLNLVMRGSKKIYNLYFVDHTIRSIQISPDERFLLIVTLHNVILYDIEFLRHDELR